MNDKSLLGPWVRRFLLEYAVSERNLARNTQRSYRDTLSLLIPFIGNKAGTQVERLKVIDASADRVRLFLLDLEETRGCSVATRNQRARDNHRFKSQCEFRCPFAGADGFHVIAR